MNRKEFVQSLKIGDEIKFEYHRLINKKNQVFKITEITQTHIKFFGGKRLFFEPHHLTDYSKDKVVAYCPIIREMTSDEIEGYNMSLSLQAKCYDLLKRAKTDELIAEIELRNKRAESKIKKIQIVESKIDDTTGKLIYAKIRDVKMRGELFFIFTKK